MSKKIILDKFEREIEGSFDLLKSIKDLDKEMAMLRTAAKKHVSRKKPITIRISETDLEVMQIKASKHGIPYQTYINMVIHKDATSGI